MNIKGIRTIDDLFELLNVREFWYDCRMKDNTLELRFKNKLNCRRKLVVKYDIITKGFYGYEWCNREVDKKWETYNINEIVNKILEVSKKKAAV